MSQASNGQNVLTSNRSERGAEIAYESDNRGMTSPTLPTVPSNGSEFSSVTTSSGFVDQNSADSGPNCFVVEPSRGNHSNNSLSDLTSSETNSCSVEDRTHLPKTQPLSHMDERCKLNPIRKHPSESVPFSLGGAAKNLEPRVFPDKYEDIDLATPEEDFHVRARETVRPVHDGFGSRGGCETSGHSEQLVVGRQAVTTATSVRSVDRPSVSYLSCLLPWKCASMVGLTPWTHQTGSTSPEEDCEDSVPMEMNCGQAGGSPHFRDSSLSSGQMMQEALRNKKIQVEAARRGDFGQPLIPTERVGERLSRDGKSSDCNRFRSGSFPVVSSTNRSGIPFSTHGGNCVPERTFDRTVVDVSENVEPVEEESLSGSCGGWSSQRLFGTTSSQRFSGTMSSPSGTGGEVPSSVDPGNRCHTGMASPEKPACSSSGSRTLPEHRLRCDGTPSRTCNGAPTKAEALKAMWCGEEDMQVESSEPERGICTSSWKETGAGGDPLGGVGGKSSSNTCRDRSPPRQVASPMDFTGTLQPKSSSLQRVRSSPRGGESPPSESKPSCLPTQLHSCSHKSPSRQTEAVPEQDSSPSWQLEEFLQLISLPPPSSLEAFEALPQLRYSLSQRGGTYHGESRPRSQPEAVSERNWSSPQPTASHAGPRGVTPQGMKSASEAGGVCSHAHYNSRRGRRLCVRETRRRRQQQAMMSSSEEDWSQMFGQQPGCSHTHTSQNQPGGTSQNQFGGAAVSAWHLLKERREAAGHLPACRGASQTQEPCGLGETTRDWKNGPESDGLPSSDENWDDHFAGTDANPRRLFRPFPAGGGDPMSGGSSADQSSVDDPDRTTCGDKGDVCSSASDEPVHSGDGNGATFDLCGHGKSTTDGRLVGALSVGPGSGNGRGTSRKAEDAQGSCRTSSFLPGGEVTPARPSDEPGQRSLSRADWTTSLTPAVSGGSFQVHTENVQVSDRDPRWKGNVGSKDLPRPGTSGVRSSRNAKEGFSNLFPLPDFESWRLLKEASERLNALAFAAEGDSLAPSACAFFGGEETTDARSPSRVPKTKAEPSCRTASKNVSGSVAESCSVNSATVSLASPLLKAPRTDTRKLDSQAKALWVFSSPEELLQRDSCLNVGAVPEDGLSALDARSDVAMPMQDDFSFSATALLGGAMEKSPALPDIPARLGEGFVSPSSAEQPHSDAVRPVDDPFGSAMFPVAGSVPRRRNDPFSPDGLMPREPGASQVGDHLPAAFPQSAGSAVTLGGEDPLVLLGTSFTAASSTSEDVTSSNSAPSDGTLLQLSTALPSIDAVIASWNFPASLSRDPGERNSLGEGGQQRGETLTQLPSALLRLKPITVMARQQFDTVTTPSGLSRPGLLQTQSTRIEPSSADSSSRENTLAAPSRTRSSVENPGSLARLWQKNGPPGEYHLRLALAKAGIIYREGLREGALSTDEFPWESDVEDAEDANSVEASRESPVPDSDEFSLLEGDPSATSDPRQSRMEAILHLVTNGGASPRSSPRAALLRSPLESEGTSGGPSCFRREHQRELGPENMSLLLPPWEVDNQVMPSFDGEEETPGISTSQSRNGEQVPSESDASDASGVPNNSLALFCRYGGNATQARDRLKSELYNSGQMNGLTASRSLLQNNARGGPSLENRMRSNPAVGVSQANPVHPSVGSHGDVEFSRTTSRSLSLGSERTLPANFFELLDGEERGLPQVSRYGRDPTSSEADPVLGGVRRLLQRHGYHESCPALDVVSDSGSELEESENEDSYSADDEFDCDCDACISIRQNPGFLGDLPTSAAENIFRAGITSLSRAPPSNLDESRNRRSSSNEAMEQNSDELLLPPFTMERDMLQRILGFTGNEYLLGELALFDSPEEEDIGDADPVPHLLADELIWQSLPPVGLSTLALSRLPISPATEVDAGRTCVICQQEVLQGEQLIKLPCLHAFHQPCLRDWLSRADSCPMCRRKVE